MTEKYEVQDLGNIGVRVFNKPENICVGFYQSDAGVLAEICHGEGTT